MSGSDATAEPSAEPAELDESSDDPAFHARRAALYGYVATAFQYPDEETVADLTDDEVRGAVREAAFELGLVEPVDRLLAALADTSRGAMAGLYSELFGLPSGEDGTYPVVPYEAHYTTGSEVNETQRRIATVVGLLEEFGLEPADAFDERQDHVAVELELLEVLAAQRAVALAEGDEPAAADLERAEATVLDEHLASFVPAFAHGVERATTSETYRAAADLAARLVEWDVARHPTPDPNRGDRQ